ncbi:probable G-protein coupled receptor 82 [Lepisosteus oculatus]|uniref:probable G-protein coupled receptor 82 n=1 Tax=Lepisosteus oculatus TaxID=7918 RepID=UPI00073FEF13|nr:PREDICTED: probable G-protein coupled receptor 82 [Lepisosteus oculatus]
MANVSHDAAGKGDVCWSNVSCLCPSHGTRSILPLLYFLMFITGLPGNALSLQIFVKKMTTKTSTHFYLTNLAVSNMLLCAVMPFLSMYYMMGYKWQVNTVVCKMITAVVTPIFHINIYMGMFILSWIALSRYAILMKSYEHRDQCHLAHIHSSLLKRFRELSFAKMLCLGIWTFVISAIVPVVLYYSFSEVGGEEACYGQSVEIGGEASQISSAIAIAVFLFCFLLVLLSYVSVTRHLYNIQKSSAIPGKSRIYSRVFRNILVIQVVLAVCLLPHHIYKAVFIKLVRPPACDRLSLLVEVKNFLLCLAALRCSTDPLMYFFLDNTFRRHCKSLLKCSSAKHSSQSSGSSKDWDVNISHTKHTNVPEKQFVRWEVAP